MDSIGKKQGFTNEQYYIVPDEFVDHYRSVSGSHPLILERMGYFPKARQHYCDYDSPSDTVVIYCAAGSGYCIHDNKKKHVLEAGSITVFQPKVPRLYAASDSDPWSIFFLNYSGKSAINMSFLEFPVFVSNTYGEWMRELFHRCFYTLKMPFRIEEYTYLCSMAETILSIIPCVANRSPEWISSDIGKKVGGVERAIDFIKNRLHDNLTLDQIAQAASFSPSHLDHLFKRYTGYTPIEYFLRAKIQAAARDIFFSDSSISEIACRYGIEDPYYFSRLFKKIMGVSPRQYRENQDHKSLQELLCTNQEFIATQSESRY